MGFNALETRSISQEKLDKIAEGFDISEVGWSIRKYLYLTLVTLIFAAAGFLAVKVT